MPHRGTSITGRLALRLHHATLPTARFARPRIAIGPYGCADQERDHNQIRHSRVTLMDAGVAKPPGPDTMTLISIMSSAVDPVV
jgi:hypothetical protein